MFDVIRATARLVRDYGVATDTAVFSRAANAFAALANEPQWWRCSDPGWWSVQTIWVGDGEADVVDPKLEPCPIQLLVEVVDRGECRVSSIEDWQPQGDGDPYSLRDRSFGHVLPGRGPVRVLAYSPPPFGDWIAA
jgi:hypothetical protein